MVAEDAPSMVDFGFRFGIRFGISLKSGEVESLDAHDFLFVFVDRRQPVRFRGQIDKNDIVGTGINFRYRGEEGVMVARSANTPDRPSMQTAARRNNILTPSSH
jgi:hypothetical protein